MIQNIKPISKVELNNCF